MTDSDAKARPSAKTGPDWPIPFSVPWISRRGRQHAATGRGRECGWRAGNGANAPVQAVCRRFRPRPISARTFFCVMPRGRVCRRFQSAVSPPARACTARSGTAAADAPFFFSSRVRFGCTGRCLCAARTHRRRTVRGSRPASRHRRVFAPVVGSGRQNLHSLGRTNPSLRSAISSLQSIQAKSTTTPTPIPSATRIPTYRSSKSCMNGVRTTPLIEIIT